MYAVQGSCLTLDDMLICGTMGHIAPNDPYYDEPVDPYRYTAPPTEEEERSYLGRVLEDLESQVKAVKDRIKALKSKK